MDEIIQATSEPAKEAPTADDILLASIDTLYYSRWGVFRLESQGQLVETTYMPEKFGESWVRFNQLDTWKNEQWACIGTDPDQERDWGWCFKRRTDPLTQNRIEAKE